MSLLTVARAVLDAFTHSARVTASHADTSLRQVFAAFGGIIDIVAMKSLKRRGQAAGFNKTTGKIAV